MVALDPFRKAQMFEHAAKFPKSNVLVRSPFENLSQSFLVLSHCTSSPESMGFSDSPQNHADSAMTTSRPDILPASMPPGVHASAIARPQPPSSTATGSK